MNSITKTNYVRPRRLRVITAGVLLALSLAAMPGVSAGESGRFVVLDFEQVDLSLDSRDRKRFTFRTINLFGVTGPEHRVEIVLN